MTLAAVLLSLCIALLGLTPSIYATQIMGRFVTHGRMSTLVTMLTGLAIALLGELLLRVMRFRVLSAVSAEADEELANALFGRSSEKEQTRAMILLESVSATYSAGRIAALMDIPTAILYIAALWWISADIGAGACIAIVIAVLFDLAMGRISSIASAAGNVVRNRVLTSPSVEARRSVVADWVDSAVRTGQLAAFREGTISMSNSTIYSVVLTIGAIMVVNDDVGSSALFGAGLLGSRAAAIALRMGGLFTDLKRGQPAMEVVVQILSAPQPAPASEPHSFANRRTPVSNSAL
jgi:ABC-type bacteriocin/lantibiotic exporter with double-glycine peptidase domain